MKSMGKISVFVPRDCKAAAQQLADAIGAKPGDTINIHTPIFDRVDGLKVSIDVDFAALPNATKEERLALGMQHWDESLWLFPYEWFPIIPEGLVLKTINGETITFNEHTTPSDTRYGMLSYGWEYD